jgi:hypothetical protein
MPPTNGKGPPAFDIYRNDASARDVTGEFDGVDRRAGQRAILPIPVRIRGDGGESREGRILDVNLRGLAMEPADDARPGQTLTLLFDGYPGVVPKFEITGDVVRILEDKPNAMGVKIDRRRNSTESLGHYRRLILYFLRHKPLLARVDWGHIEGRCVACSWVGRVGKRTQRCPCCGSKVEAVQK